MTTKEYFKKKFDEIETQHHYAKEAHTEYAYFIEDLQNLSPPCPEGYNEAREEMLTQLKALHEELEAFLCDLPRDKEDNISEAGHEIMGFSRDLATYREHLYHYTEEMPSISTHYIISELTSEDDLDLEDLPEFPDVSWGYDWQHNIETNFTAALFPESEQNTERTFFLMPDGFRFATVFMETHKQHNYMSHEDDREIAQTQHEFTFKVGIRCDNTTQTTTTTATTTSPTWQSPPDEPATAENAEPSTAPKPAPSCASSQTPSDKKET